MKKNTIIAESQINFKNKGRKSYQQYIVAGIPAYNEEKTIAKIVLLTRQYVDKVIVVDDGSTDMTGDIAEALGAEVIRHPSNLGKGAVIKTILEKAKEEKPNVLILLDADGQHNPKDIPKLITPLLQKKADMVIGSRFLGKSKIPKYRRFGLGAVNVMVKILLNRKITDPLSGFRAVSKNALELLDLTEKGYGIEIEMLLKALKCNLNIVEVPIKMIYDNNTKTSKQNPISQFIEIISVLLRKTIFKRPLVYLGIPGFVSLLIGIITIVYLFIIYSISQYFSIPISLISFGAIILGIILLLNSFVIALVIQSKRNNRP